MKLLVPPAAASAAPSLAVAFVAGATVGTFAFRIISNLVRRRRSVFFSEAEAHLWKIVDYSFTGALIYAGDQLHLYELLWQQQQRNDGSSYGVTAAELAKETGWSERWLFEWLAHTTAAGFCSYDQATDQFSLKKEYAALLREPEKEKRSLVGMFQFLHALVCRPESTAKAIQTGQGVDYDYDDYSMGKDVIEGMDRKNRNFFVQHLIEDVIEKFTVPSTEERLVQMLDRGVNVADVGCGCGTSTIVLAKRFPKSRFFGYELSPKSLQIFQDRVDEGKLDNITVCNVAQRTVGDGPYPGRGQLNNSFSFVYSHDLLHDMTNPRQLIQEVRKSLSQDGCWIIVDMNCGDSLSKNLKMPAASISLGFSCLLCLSSATAVAGGEGLGTLGFHPALARQWTQEAGFQYFEGKKIKSLPGNSCFIVA